MVGETPLMNDSIQLWDEFSAYRITVDIITKNYNLSLEHHRLVVDNGEKR